MADAKSQKILNVAFLVTLLLAGCAGKEGASQETLTQGNSSSREAASYVFLEDAEPEWKDNSQDDWQAAINAPLKELKVEGERSGGRKACLVGEGGAVWFKNHIMGSHKTDWSGVSGISIEGMEFAEKPIVDPEREGMQMEYLGIISGKRGYVTYVKEYDDEYNVKARRFYELDESFRKVGEFLTQIPMRQEPIDIMGDGEGNIHLTYRGDEDNGLKYAIFSKEGRLVFEISGNFGRLRAFGNGRVAVCEVMGEGSLTKEAPFVATGERIVTANLETGTLMELGMLSYETLRSETKMRETTPFCITPLNEEELAWCGKEGLYVCNARGEETRMAYRWSNHGIVINQVMGVTGIYVGVNETIALLYNDNNGINYLLLKPTLEKTEIKTITFAVPSFDKETYVSAAALFRRTYPEYAIEIRDDYDQISLLTQLGAGDGPVLIDTRLTGFEELEKLWQPLDGFWKEADLLNEVYPEALDFGRIGDTTYGIANSFAVRSFVVADQNLTDWDYEDFLKSVEAFEGATFTAEWFQTPSDNRNYFFHVLSNGLSDNAFFDAENGSSVFGTPEFERITRLSEKAKQCPNAEKGKALQSKEALCELRYVSGVAGLVDLRSRREAGEKVIGYPTKNGARYLLSAPRLITLRRTATDEEKMIAYTFFRLLLSHEVAELSVKGNVYALYSVRRDTLEDQFDYYEKVASAYAETGIGEVMPELDRKKERELFEEMLGNSIVEKDFPAGLQHVFDEEFGEYLDGRIDGKTLDDHLKNRVWLYLQEAK